MAQEAGLWKGASPEGVGEFSQHEQSFLQSLQKQGTRVLRPGPTKLPLAFPTAVPLNLGHTEQAKNPDPRDKPLDKSS